MSLTDEQRERLQVATGHSGIFVRDVIAPVVAQMLADERAEALREAARFFEYDMSKAWGGEARWFSTGNHVADLVADVLRERAAEAEDATP